jgi:hypothetical protein
LSIEARIAHPERPMQSRDASFRAARIEVPNDSEEER